MHQIPQSPPLSPHTNVPVPKIYPESDIMLETEDDFLPKQQTAKPPSRGASKYKQKSMIQIQEDLKRRSSMQLSVGAWKVVNGKPVAPDESDSPIKKVDEKHDGSEEEHLKEGEEGEKGRDFGLGGKPWHLFPVKRLLKTLDSAMEGLSSEENEERIKKYGLNRITPPKQMHWIVKFLINLVAGFQMMLWAGAIMCFVVYGISSPHDIQSLALAIVLILVVVLTTIFQSYQESQSDNVMKALKALSAAKCFVFRDGGLVEVDAESLVPGDIVSVKAGEKVPADLRVISASDLKVNNASLTGENVDIKLGPDANHKELYEAKNIARSGCVFTCGHGLCIVFATGDNTFFGSIAKSTVSIKRPDTCLKREIKRLIHIMAIVAFTIGITFLILALTSGYPPIEAVIFMIGIIVANVPEGLLPQMTVALTLTAKRMLRKGVLVTNLEIIETLGATTVICSDKTGTLTCNRMSVSHLVYDKEIHSTPITPVMAGDNFKMFDTRDEHFIALQKIATLNCDAVFLSENENVLNRDIKGDASEGALIKFVHPLQDIYEYRLACPRVFAIPFNSSNKWMCSINVQGVNKYCSSPKKNLLLMLKGAPEKIIAMCSSIYHKGEIHNIDENGRKELENTNEALAKRGERVLAFAQLELDNTFHEGFAFQQEPPNFPLKDLTFVGFISLIDPPRMTVKPAINDCYTAGIKVFMVTGDHPITAHAIAKSLNLITYPTQDELIAEGKGSEIARAAVVHGTQLAKFSQGDWDELLKHEQIVFARTMPQQKQDIVTQLNKLKHIVAMTGDGVNDAPALKAANVGIAMGSGAAVAKEAAQIILLNDDFGSIVDGVKEGRLIFENLKKCISYVLTSNIPELIPFLLFIAAKIPLAIETIMILCIDLGTDLAPAVALAYEEPESLIMNVPPRKPTDHLVGPHLMFISYCILGVFQTFGAFFAFYYVLYDNGFTVDVLFGVGPLFKLKYSDFDDQQKRDLLDLCLGNNFYIENYLNPSPDKTCQNDIEEFKRWSEGIISIAQSAFFITVVWCQIGAIINRKTQVASSLTFNRFFGNPKLFIALLIELVIMFSIIYIPGLNNALLFDSVKAKWAACALWILPFFIIWDETRKYLCRRNPNGWMMKYSNF